MIIKLPNKDAKKRDNMKNNIWKRFLSCVKKIHNTNIILKNKLEVFTIERFFLLKKKYALNLCALYDFSIWFIYIFASWPNFLHNAQIYASTYFQKYLKNYFAFGEYLLGNIIYTNSFHLVFLYKSLFTNKKENWRFNQKLSQIHVDIKRMFKVLKDW